MRIAVVKNIVAPYTTPVFEALAAMPDVDLLVVYEARTESNRRWRADAALGFEHTFLSSWTLNPRGLSPETFVHLSLPPLGTLRRFAPDVVIGSGGVWHSPTNLAMAAARGRHGWAVVPWWGQFGEWRTGVLHGVADRVKSAYVRAGDAWLAYSTRARDDAVRLGADRERVVIAPNAALPARPGDRDASDRPHGFRFLFSGQLIERKGLPELLEAFAGLDGCELWIAGAGPLLPDVQAAAGRNGRLRYLGHLAERALSRVYDRVDAVVLPSRYDVWGLVINEAFSHGLPVIATTAVGALGDLVEIGRTGLAVPAESPDHLRRALREMSAWPAERRRAARDEALRRVRAYTPQATAASIVRAGELAVEFSGQHPRARRRRSARS